MGQPTGAQQLGACSTSECSLPFKVSLRNFTIMELFDSPLHIACGSRRSNRNCILANSVSDTWQLFWWQELGTIVPLREKAAIVKKAISKVKPETGILLCPLFSLSDGVHLYYLSTSRQETFTDAKLSYRSWLQRSSRMK